MDHQAFAQLLGNYGEFLGAIAVVATLAYLAMQIRQNTAQMRLDSMAKAVETQVHQFAHLTESKEKGDLVRRALADFDSLSQDEEGLIHTTFLEIAISHNVIRHLHQAGLVDKGEFATLQSNWVSLMRTNGGRVWYEQWRHTTPPDWQAYADDVLSDPNQTVKPLDEDLPWLYKLNADAS
jgi:hypothetical protein